MVEVEQDSRGSEQGKVPNQEEETCMIWGWFGREK